MTNHITISWNSDRLEETKVRLTPEFEKLEWIEKADLLKDAIYDLQGIYAELIQTGPTPKVE